MSLGNLDAKNHRNDAFQNESTQLIKFGHNLQLQLIPSNQNQASTKTNILINCIDNITKAGYDSGVDDFDCNVIQMVKHYNFIDLLTNNIDINQQTHYHKTRVHELEGLIDKSNNDETKGVLLFMNIMFNFLIEMIYELNVLIREIEKAKKYVYHFQKVSKDEVELCLNSVEIILNYYMNKEKETNDLKKNFKKKVESTSVVNKFSNVGEIYYWIGTKTNDKHFSNVGLDYYKHAIIVDNPQHVYRFLQLQTHFIQQHFSSKTYHELLPKIDETNLIDPLGENQKQISLMFKQVDFLNNLKHRAGNQDIGYNKTIKEQIDLETNQNERLDEEFTLYNVKEKRLKLREALYILINIYLAILFQLKVHYCTESIMN
jgi:hypothetical protein